jgi:competence protein ComEA
MSSNKIWMIVTVVLVAVIVVTGSIIRARWSSGQPVEISLPTPTETPIEVSIDGAINNPGIYPFQNGDNLDDIIEAAGGTTEEADLTKIRLYVPGNGDESQPQKININRADAWLLEALPDIGPARAEAIVHYREQNGPFHSIQELQNLEGMGDSTFEKIKGLITVAE